LKNREREADPAVPLLEPIEGAVSLTESTHGDQPVARFSGKPSACVIGARAGGSD